MAYGILIENATSATELDSLNRNVKSASSIENGSVFNLLTIGTGSEREVWVATTPATGALTNLWMAGEPEVVTTVSGTHSYKGLDPDPRSFINIAGTVFRAFQPKIGDVITLSEDAVGGTISTNTFVVATDAQLKLQWAAAAVSGTSLKLRETTYVSIPDGSIGNQRTIAYRFDVIAVA